MVDYAVSRAAGCAVGTIQTVMQPFAACLNISDLAMIAAF